MKNQTVEKAVNQETAAAEIRQAWRIETWVDRGTPSIAILAKTTGYPEEFVSLICEQAGYETS